MKRFNIKKRISSLVVGLIFASAIIISSCEDVTNSNGDLSGYAALSVLSESHANVGQTIITTVAQLADIGVGLPADGNYELGANLTLGNWEPICGTVSGTVPFTGTFDGAGYTITVNSFDPDVTSGTDSIGIFAETAQNATTYNPAAISNLTVNIAAPAYKYNNTNIGVIVGDATNAAFNNITVTGAFNADLVSGDQNAGGVAGKAVSAQFNNVIVTADFDVNSVTGSTPVVNVGGVAGYADSSAFSNVKVSGNYNDTLNSTAAAPNGKLVLTEGEYRFLGLTTPGSDGLNIGGVAGHVEASQFSADGQSKPSQFTAVISNVTINATGVRAPVYLGGVVGYANGANIDNAQVSGSITGRGDNYNTSAGGVAGYVINSRISDSFATAAVDLQAHGVNFDDYDSWQIYAGGLVGYVGGSNYGPSLVDHSYATGNVTAYAPFPYAGGLVGYLYGYNDFSTPAKNGSTVKRSYAAGSVRSESQPDPNNKYGDIPYAGGLVGYSSIKGSTIVDSYATGAVAARTNGTFAWAGGIIGGNANDAVVIRTYATGNVTSNTGSLPPIYSPYHGNVPGPAAGGIAGFNYYTANTLVSNSVALNETIYGNQSASQNVVHRVVGNLGNDSGYIGSLDNNYANENVVIGNNWQSHIGPNFEDGADVLLPPPQSLYERLGWDFSRVWQLTGAYPTLR